MVISTKGKVKSKMLQFMQRMRKLWNRNLICSTNTRSSTIIQKKDGDTNSITAVDGGSRRKLSGQEMNLELQVEHENRMEQWFINNKKYLENGALPPEANDITVARSDPGPSGTVPSIKTSSSQELDAHILGEFLGTPVQFSATYLVYKKAFAQILNIMGDKELTDQEFADATRKIRQEIREKRATDNPESFMNTNTQDKVEDKSHTEVGTAQKSTTTHDTSTVEGWSAESGSQP